VGRSKHHSPASLAPKPNSALFWAETQTGRAEGSHSLPMAGVARDCHPDADVVLTQLFCRIWLVVVDGAEMRRGERRGESFEAWGQGEGDE